MFDVFMYNIVCITFQINLTKINENTKRNTSFLFLILISKIIFFINVCNDN